MVTVKEQSRLDLRRYSFSQSPTINGINYLANVGLRASHVNMLDTFHKGPFMENSR